MKQTTETTIEPGIYPDIPFGTYLAWDAVSASFLKDMLHTPHYAITRRDDPEEEKDCYDKGKLFHCLSLEPAKRDEWFIMQPASYPVLECPAEDWSLRRHDHDDDATLYRLANGRGKSRMEYAVKVKQDADGSFVPVVVGGEAPETLTEIVHVTMKDWNNNATYCSQWKANRPGKTILTETVLDEATEMAAQVRGLPALRPFLKDAQTELSVVWRDKATGLLCKARFDGYKNWAVIDAKSNSTSAHPDVFPYDARRYRYGIQAAHYIEAIKSIEQPKGADSKPIREVPLFSFIVTEGYKPFDLLAYDVEDNMEAQSWDYLRFWRYKRNNLMAQVKVCMERNEWPGYGDLSVDMSLTPQETKELMELEKLSIGIIQ
jgi:hypothetical protein